MEKKCNKCGRICSKGDIFCSRCGKRLEESDNNIFLNNKNTSNVSSYNSQTKKAFEDIFTSTLVLLLMMFIGVCVLLYFILTKHDAQKDVLQFKNLMINPAQIPLLKEPQGYVELRDNLISVEKFLTLYMEQSNDSTEKKSQIFASFLNQMEKLPTILNQKYNPEDIIHCSNTKTIKACVAKLNNIMSPAGVKVYNDEDSIYLYPDYSFIKKTYYKNLNNDYKKLLSLQNKYNYPVSLGLNLYIHPKKLADKIYDFEKLHLNTQDENIKECAENILYQDVRRFIFTPAIYQTTTQEMKKNFHSAFNYFVSTKKDSALRPLIMSYLDKKRSYSENNFKNDYPYKKFEQTNFNNNVKKSAFDDVFVQLRKSYFANKNTQSHLSYVYNVKSAQWNMYSQQNELKQGDYVLSEPDENNNVSFYNHMFSPMQEMNILKYSKLYLINNVLYVFNKDKLSISKVTFNGRTFNLYNLAFSDISSIFPGIEVINMDTVSNYNVFIEKGNAKAAFIVMSRYSQGWNDYNLKVEKGNVQMLAFPNMFAINSVSDVIISFGVESQNDEEIIENTPSYKFIIKTAGHKEKNEELNNQKQNDVDVNNEETQDNHTPNIMPKMFEKSESTELEDNDLLNPPSQQIDPPNEND